MYNCERLVMNVRTLLNRCFFAATFLLTAHCLLLTAQAQIAVKGETVWTMAGEPIKNGVVLISGGKIEAVGAEGQVTIPANYKILTAKVVTPGLIDAHTVVGLSGYLNQPHDQMQLEVSAPMQPELRAIDAYNAEEKLVEWLRGFGITTIHTGHSQGSLISGQTMIAKTVGNTVDDATIVTTAMVAANLGDSALAGAGQIARHPRQTNFDAAHRIIKSRRRFEKNGRRARPAHGNVRQTFKARDPADGHR